MTHRLRGQPRTPTPGLGLRWDRELRYRGRGLPSITGADGCGTRTRFCCGIGGCGTRITEAPGFSSPPELVTVAQGALGAVTRGSVGLGAEVQGLQLGRDNGGAGGFGCSSAQNPPRTSPVCCRPEGSLPLGRCPGTQPTAHTPTPSSRCALGSTLIPTPIPRIPSCHTTQPASHRPLGSSGAQCRDVSF